MPKFDNTNLHPRVQLIMKRLLTSVTGNEMKLKFVAVVLPLVFAVSAHANPDKIREAITKSFPGMEIKSVQHH